MHETPLLIQVSAGTFAGYIDSLAKTGRKNFRYVEKNNSDVGYSRIDFQPVLIERFMRLWERQEVGGGKPQWGFGMGFVEFLHERGHLLCFAASKLEDSREVLALHFVEQHGDYLYCHPPMYDKEAHNDRYIAKYMWFHLIEYALVDPNIAWLDLGGGNNGTWRDLLLNRDRHPGYKWLYVPDAVKDAPHEATPYRVKTRLIPYGMYLQENGAADSAVRRYFTKKYLTFVLLNRKRRLQKLARVFNRAIRSLIVA